MKELYGDEGTIKLVKSMCIESVIVDAKISQLESLNSEVRFNGCTTAVEVLAIIKSDMAVLIKLKNEKGL